MWSSEPMSVVPVETNITPPGWPNAIVGDPNGRPVIIQTSPSVIMAFTDASGTPQQVTLTSAGSQTLGTPGQIVSGLDITGTVSITANNTTLQQCRIKGSSVIGTVTLGGSVTGVTIQDCLIDSLGGSDSPTCINYPLDGVGGNQFLRNNLINWENGFGACCNNDLIKDNYVHQAVAAGSPHYDSIQMFQHDSITIIHNTLDDSLNNENSNINATSSSGNITNMVIEDNLMLGSQFVGSSVLYDLSQGSKGDISVASFKNNHIQRSPGGINQGYSRVITGSGGTMTSFTHSGNVDSDTLANIDSLLPG